MGYPLTIIYVYLCSRGNSHSAHVCLLLPYSDINGSNAANVANINQRINIAIIANVTSANKLSVLDNPPSALIDVGSIPASPVLHEPDPEYVHVE